MRSRAFLYRLAIFFTICSLFYSEASFPCSAIARQTATGAQIVAANFDWRARGGIVYLSPRGQIKETSLRRVTSKELGIPWVSKFASLTVSQFGRDYPMQGINEMGLMGAVLVAPAAYPHSGGQGLITENLWLQYQLDRYASVEDVVKHIGDLGIRKISADLHWFLCDASGECVVVEFESSGPRVFRSRNMHEQVLTNSPVSESWQHYRSWKASDAEVPRGYGSLARFIRLALSQLAESHNGVVDTLNDVALDNFTAWQSVFDLRSRTFRIRQWGGYFQKISFYGLPLRCSRVLPVFNLSDRIWQPYDPVKTNEILHDATQGLPMKEIQAIEAASKRAEDVRCVEN